MGWYGFAPYVSVAQRRANAEREMAKLAKKGQVVTPVKIASRQITSTFWGKAWCQNLESYSDYANRLPRGRTYVRNGSVVDLQIHPGKVTARVSGSSLYNIDIKIKPLCPDHWQLIGSQCAGQIASVVELLQGKFSSGVMEVITHRESGLFPKPEEISLHCSCPDWAYMCKHIAAALYGIGARLDEKPELLFVLRQVDHLELIERAAAGHALAPAAGSGVKTIAEGDLADVFGVEIDMAAAAGTAPPAVIEKLKPRAARTTAKAAKIAAKIPDAAKTPAKTPKRAKPAAKRGEKLAELIARAKAARAKPAKAKARPKRRGAK